MVHAHTLISHKAENPVGLTESNSEGSHRFSPPHSYSQLSSLILRIPLTALLCFPTIQTEESFVLSHESLLSAAVRRGITTQRNQSTVI